MNKTPRLSNSDIEYLDKVWNFTSGCQKGCSYCYAEKITKRFTNHYPNGFNPTVYPEALLSPLYLKKPSRIGVCFMGDLFTDCPEFNPDRKNISSGFTEDGSSWEDISFKQIFNYVIDSCPQHTFVFLTKQPQNLPAWSPFPDNCWVGVSATDHEQWKEGVRGLRKIEASVKFFSFEPLLHRIGVKFYDFDDDTKWVIIGAQTKPTVMPKIEWVREIVEACDKAGIPVFLKDNLIPIFDTNKDGLFLYPEWAMNKEGFSLRQEFPK